MNRFTFAALLCAIIAAPAAHGQPAQAQAFSYDYLEAYYVNTDLDASGFELGGSYALSGAVHVFGAYLDQDYGDGFDRSTLQLGAGYRWPVRSNVDLIAELALASSELDRSDGPDVDDDGFIVSGRMRGWMSDDVELNGALHIDDSADDTDLIVEFGGQYYLSPELSIGGRLRTDEEATALFLGGRYRFR
jgi:hypothetical protein